MSNPARFFVVALAVTLGFTVLTAACFDFTTTPKPDAAAPADDASSGVGDAADQ